MSVASSLLEIILPAGALAHHAVHRGPCTSGPGLIVDTDLGETIRAHVDIEREKAPHMKEAQKFYESVADRCRKNRQSVDLFACCLDQVGLLEMRSASRPLAALCVLGDSFGQSVFQQSLSHVFEVYPDDYRQSGRPSSRLSRRRRLLDDGLRRHHRGADHQRVQGQRLHRSLHLPEEGWRLRRRAGDRRERHRQLVPGFFWIPRPHSPSTSRWPTARTPPSRTAVAACNL